MHNPECILKNETRKILWDFDIQTDHLISTRQPDQVIVTKKKKKQTKKNQKKKQKQNKKKKQKQKQKNMRKPTELRSLLFR